MAWSVGQFVLGDIDFRSLVELGRKRKTGVIAPERMWLIGFYKGMTELEAGQLRLADFRKLAKQMVDLSKPDWAQELDFLHLIWKDEFFIARYEARE